MNEQQRKELRAAQVLQGQIELLKRGCRATDYACREFLNLRIDSTPVEVVAAVHARIHASGRGKDEGDWFLVLAALTAGQQILKGQQEVF